MTLVIHPAQPDGIDASSVSLLPTFWAESSFSEIKAARENLRQREGSGSKFIHAIDKHGAPHHPTEYNTGVEEMIHAWLQENREHGLDAAVWTGLPSNWKDKRGCEFSPEDALAYIREVEMKKDRADATFSKLEEYFRNAPAAVDTELRRMVVAWKNWREATLPDILFEPPPDSTP